MIRRKLDRVLIEPLEVRALLSATPQVMGYVVDYKLGDSSNSVLSENSSGKIVHDTLDWADLNEINYFALLPSTNKNYNGNPSSAKTATSNGNLLSTTDSGFDPAAQLPSLVADAKKHNVKVFVTVGGGDANAIYRMDALVNTPSAWSNFAGKIKSLCSKYGISGVDIDWEPTAQSGFTVSKTQLDNFGNFVKTIKQANAGLGLTVEALGDPIDVTGHNPALMLTAKAVQNADKVNVEAYPVGSKSESDTIMQNWASYLAGGKDIDGALVHTSVSKLQYGVDIDPDDSSNKPAGVIEGKVDKAVAKGYGGLFIFELGSDIHTPSVVSRIGAEIRKDTSSGSSAKLTGMVIGSSNALHNAKSGHSASKAFDGSISTTFEDKSANNNWIGLDLGKGFKITQIKFAADPANPSFMEGGVFQASNSATFSSGVVNLYTVPNTSTPSTSLTSVNINASTKYRYVRYLAPADSFGDVAEIQFFGIG